MNRIRYIVAVVVAILCSHVLLAQNASVKAYLDSTYVIIGSPTTIHLEATHDAGDTLLFPDVLQGIVVHDDSTQYKLEVYDNPKTDTLESLGGKVTIRQDILAYVYDSADLYIPPFDFLTPQGDTLQSNSLALRVIVPFEVEVNPQKICDIKENYSPQFVIWDYADWVLWPLLFILLVLGGFLGWKHWKKLQMRKSEGYVAPVEKKAPHLVAMEALEELGEKKLWQRGFDKQYYVELTEIIRVYICDRFTLPAMELTSEEILARLRDQEEVSKSCMMNLRQIFTQADLAKFAKYRPMADDNELSFLNAKMFVSQTVEVKSVDTTPAVEGEEEVITQ